MAIRVAIGDDDPLIREALEVILGKDPDFELVAQAADGVEAVRACLAAKAEVALLDIRMPRMSGIEAAARIVSESPCKVLLLSTFKDDELVRGALKCGASGYLLKGCGGAEIKQAIRLVRAGHAVFHGEVFAAIREGSKDGPGDLSALGEREREIALLVAEGCTNKEVADRLCLSEGTVKNYVSLVLDKLGLRQRTQIAVYCVSGRKDFS
jgi:DNA-binding NarL/FixJ family response regulator